MPANRRSAIFAAGLLLLFSVRALGQDSGTSKEFWPALRVNFDLHTRIGAQVYAEKHNGEDFSLAQWKVGGLVSFRVRRMLQKLIEDIDRDKEYNLALAVGYEFISTEQTNSSKREHRVFIQGTPRYMLPGHLLIQDRSRMEFRWTDGAAYNFRYRNKLSVERSFKIDKVRLIPYASGELFWDRNHHEWNENQYAFGVQIPYKKVLMLDTYYLRQNCTTCSQDPVGVFGLRLNLYFRQK